MGGSAKAGGEKAMDPGSSERGRVRLRAPRTDAITTVYACARATSNRACIRYVDVARAGYIRL